MDRLGDPEWTHPSMGEEIMSSLAGVNLLGGN